MIYMNTYMYNADALLLYYFFKMNLQFLLLLGSTQNIIGVGIHKYMNVYFLFFMFFLQSTINKKRIHEI